MCGRHKESEMQTSFLESLPVEISRFLPTCINNYNLRQTIINYQNPTTTEENQGVEKTGRSPETSSKTTEIFDRALAVDKSHKRSKK